jgi:MFS family permease
VQLSAQAGAAGAIARHGVDSAEAWLRLAISVVLAMIGGAGMWAVVVVLPPVQAEFGIGRADASLPYVSTMIGFALGNMVIGRVIDKAGFWRPALAAGIVMACGFMLAAQTTSVLQLSLVQGVMIGGGSSALFAPLMADISRWFERRRGVAVAAAASGNYLAGAFWPSLMPFALHAYGWRGTYILMGAICLVTMIPLTLLLRRGPPAPSGKGSASRRSVRPIAVSATTLQVLLSIAGVACCVAMSMPQVHIVAYCMDLGYGVARGSEMLAIMLAAGIVSRMASGFVADRIGGIRTLLIGSVLQGLSLLLFLPFDGLASLYLVSFAFGLSQGGIVPCYAIIVREYLPAAEAGQRVGIVIMCTILGMALGGWMTGWIYDVTGSYAVAFLNGIAWNLVNVSVMVLLLWRSHRPVAAAA